jgi:hypothetical protein
VHDSGLPSNESFHWKAFSWPILGRDLPRYQYYRIPRYCFPWKVVVFSKIIRIRIRKLVRILGGEPWQNAQYVYFYLAPSQSVHCRYGWDYNLSNPSQPNFTNWSGVLRWILMVKKSYVVGRCLSYGIAYQYIATSRKLKARTERWTMDINVSGCQLRRVPPGRKWTETNGFQSRPRNFVLHSLSSGQDDAIADDRWYQWSSSMKRQESNVIATLAAKRDSGRSCRISKSPKTYYYQAERAAREVEPSNRQPDWDD